jgi:hypothetical protein
MSLPRNQNEEVYFRMVVHLPFKVHKVPEECNGYEGVQVKSYENGNIKQLVVELVSAMYKATYLNKTLPPYQDHVHFATSTELVKVAQIEVCTI